MPVLEVRGLQKSFDRAQVLRNIDFSLGQGEAISVIGSSGSGKTTLLRLLLGLETPDSGRVLYDDGAVFSVVLQEDRLLPFATALQNITLTGADAETARTMLKKLGLGNETDSFPDTLSGGMKRRVALARALCRPGYTHLLLDEPFTGLDDDTKKSVLDLLQAQTQGKTVILITHNAADAEALGAAVVTIE
jgi:NitT/TauT family transport system ATP-binding protein